MKTIYKVAVCVVSLPAAPYMPILLYICIGPVCMVNDQKTAHRCSLQGWLARQLGRTARAGPCGIAARLNFGGAWGNMVLPLYVTFLTLQ